MQSLKMPDTCWMGQHLILASATLFIHSFMLLYVRKKISHRNRSQRQLDSMRWFIVVLLPEWFSDGVAVQSSSRPSFTTALDPLFRLLSCSLLDDSS